MLSRVAEVPPDVLSLQTVEDVLHLENQAQTFPLLFNPHDLLLANYFPLSLQQLRRRKIRRSSETFSTIQFCPVLACIIPYILCEGTNGLLELFGKFKIVDDLLVLPHSFLQHYHTLMISISQNSVHIGKNDYQLVLI